MIDPEAESSLFFGSFSWCGASSAWPDSLAEFMENLADFVRIDSGSDDVITLVRKSSVMKIFPAEQARVPTSPQFGLLATILDSALSKAMHLGATPITEIRVNSLGARWCHLLAPSGDAFEITWRPPDWYSRLGRESRPRYY